MRKVLTILALMCFLFLVGGYHLLYYFHLSEIKADVKKELFRTKKSELAQLRFSPADFALLEWENDSEFRYANEMYDVVQVEKENGTIICWCLADEKETALVENYLKTQKQVPGKGPSQGLVELLKAPFLPASFFSETQPPLHRTTPFPQYSTALATRLLGVLTPPPRVC